MRTALVAVLLLTTLIPSCGEAVDSGPIMPLSDLADSYWSPTELAGARSVADVRAASKDGETLVVNGRVKDFIPGHAVFTLVDTTVDSCRELEGDACKTPWDYCCTDPTLLADNTITVEVRDESGQPLPTSVQGFHGLDHLDTVAVQGDVTRDEHGNVIVAMSALRKR